MVCPTLNLWSFPLGDELVLARCDVEGLFLLNGTARFLWEQFHDGADLAQTVRRFAARYGVPERQAKQDMEATLAGWSEGLLSDAKAHASSVWRCPERNGAVVEIDCVVNGRGFRVLLDPGDLVEEIGPRLAPVAVSHLPADLSFVTFRLTGGDGRVIVFRDRVCIAEEDSAPRARAILLQEMTVHRGPGRESGAILHAGACGTASDCVILAGATHAGKSTLCAALMAGGFYCYSDDSTVLDRQFKVSGMPFPLTLRESSWPVLDARFPSFIDGAPVHRRSGCTVRFLPSNLPANSSPAATARALVFVEYRPGASSTLQPLTPFDALLGLRQGGFWVEHDRESIAEFLSWIGRLDCYRLTYSRIDEASGIVDGLLS
jgi:Coenzyme PQQ synthesis protein D (PqqD)